MSRNINNNKNSDSIQKFCKVCQDAGKSESEYRSHFIRETRDPNSIVVCPTLLAQECRYCFKKGHTVKYCAVLKEKERTPASVRKEAPKKAMENFKGKSDINIFEILAFDSKEEVVAPKVRKSNEEFPALSSSSVTLTKSVSGNYAAALAKPVPAPKTKICAPRVDESKSNPKAAPNVKVVESSRIETNVAPWASGVSKASTKKNWAYYSESEDEDDCIPTSNWDMSYESNW